MSKKFKINPITGKMDLVSEENLSFNETITGTGTEADPLGVNPEVLAAKVDKVEGKQLSTEDFTTAEKNKLGSIAIGCGFEFTPGQTASTVTIIGSTADINSVTGIDMIYPAVVREDKSVNYKLDPINLTKKIDGTDADLSGADGDVMTVYERMYIRKVYDAVRNKQQIWFSRYNTGGFTEIPRHAVGIYMGDIDANGKLRSRSGVTPTTNKNRAEFRAAALLKGAGWYQEPYLMYEAKYFLFVLETASLNSQVALSTGATNANSTNWGNYNGYNPVWTTDGGAKSNYGAGVVTATPDDPNTANVRNGQIPISVAGFDTVTLATQMAVLHWQRDVFGHLWEEKEGINLHNSSALGARAFVCNDPSLFADDTETNYELYADLAQTDGYVSKFAQGTMLPSLVAGSSSNHCGDFYYSYFNDNPDVGWRGLFSGGHLYSGTYAGLAYFLGNGAASSRNAYIGSRLFLYME